MCIQVSDWHENLPLAAPELQVVGRHAAGWHHQARTVSGSLARLRCVDRSAHHFGAELQEDGQHADVGVYLVAEAAEQDRGVPARGRLVRGHDAQALRDAG